MALTVRYAVRSDRGLVRGNNEDSVYAGPRLLAIADGMGGHAAGEVASKIVIGTMERLDEDRPFDDLLGELRATVEEANNGIAATAAGDPELEGMGTTLTALRFVGGRVGLVHVGDSRAYMLRNGTLSQITKDDTYVQSLVDSGKITAEEATHHPRKSVILRALTGVNVDPDVSIREVRVGDRYLLCTDGLSDVVSKATLFETLSEGDPQSCADRLVELALRGGGPDNVTCIVADIEDVPLGNAVDDVPVIAGAFVDRPNTEDPAVADSAAERAARMARANTEPLPVVPAHAPPRPARAWWRVPAIVGATLVLLGAILFGTYAWTQTQYYVGQDGSEVAIFKGVGTEFGPIKFYKVAENTDLALSDLVPATRSQVMSGIPAKNLGDARAIVDNLRLKLLPMCPTPTPTPSTPQTSVPGPSTSSGPVGPTPSGSTTRPIGPPTSQSTAPEPSRSTAVPSPTSTLAPPDCRR